MRSWSWVSCRRGAACAALAVLLGAAPALSDHRSLYVLGLRAVQQARWADGVILFSKAIDDRGEAGGLVRPYGTWTESYVPHYYLGLCLYRIGDYAGALEAWTVFEGQEPAGYPRNRRKRRSVERLRAELDRRLPLAFGRLEKEVEAARRALERLAAGPFGVERGPAAESELEAIAARLGRVSEELEASAGVGSATLLRGLQVLVEEAWDEIDDLADRDQRARREARLAAELEVRERRLMRYRGAAERLAGGACSEEAIATLRELVHEPGLPTPDLGTAAPVIRLAQAYLHCGDSDRAAVYLDLAAALESSEVESMERLRRELRAAVGDSPPPAPSADEPTPERAAADYLAARAWIELGECRTDVLDALEGSRRVLDAEIASNGSELVASLLAGAVYEPFTTRALAHRNCRNGEGLLAAVAQAREVGEADEQRLEELERWVAESPLGTVYKESHALVIVGYDYDFEATGWQSLPGAREDLEAIRHALALHGFTVEVVANPTSRTLDHEIRRFVSRKGRKPDNRLLIYYAGHGWTETEYGVRNGFVVPVDAPHPEHSDEAFEYLISLDMIEVSARPMGARHAIFIFDSCFGGRPFEAARSRVLPLLGEVDRGRLLANPTRLFLSAGTEEEAVPDFSVFRRTIVRGLAGEADADRDELVLGHELASFVRREVTALSYTTPQWGVMTAGEFGQGDIAFLSRSADSGSSSLRLQIETAYWAVGRRADAPSFYRDYLELYPAGHFAGLSRHRLALAGRRANEPRPGGPHERTVIRATTPF